MTKGYIFDYGGTLDTGGHHWGKVMWHAYERCQVPVSEAQYREAYVYAERMLGSNPIIMPDFTFRQTLEMKLSIQLQFLCPKLNVPSSSLRAYLTPLLADLYALTATQTAHSREVLQRLSCQCPIVLVSNFYGNIHTVLKEFGLSPWFKGVVESAIVGLRKPAPRIFSIGVEALGVEPKEVTVVGDSLSKDILPARQIGCRTVWFKGEGWTDEPVDETVPDLVISDLSELL